MLLISRYLQLRRPSICYTADLLLGLHDDRKDYTTKVSSPSSSEPPPNGESSFSPWLRHSRNVDGKGGFSSNMSSPEKEISSRSNFFRGFTAGDQDTDLVNSFCKGVSEIIIRLLLYSSNR